MSDILARSLTKFLENLHIHSHESFHANSDTEKIVQALRYLSANEKPLDINYEHKDEKIAHAHNENASRNYRSLSLKELIELYTKAVTYAPSDSNELAISYGNRSAILFNHGYYGECIADIEHALQLNYPDNLKAKLYARKARCIYGLNINEMSPDVEVAIVECRKWLPKAEKPDRKTIKKALKNLTTDFGIKTIMRKMDYSKNVPPIPKGNLKIMRVSAAIGFDFSTKCGPHVKAARDIDVGETLLVHRNYASIIYSEFIRKYCWNCSLEVMASIPCPHCVAVVYCNEFCRDMAWQEHHDIECQIVPAMLKANMSETDIMPLRLTIKAYKEAGTFEKLKEKLAKIDTIRDPIGKSFTGNMFDDTKYVSVYTLPKSTLVLFEHSLEAALVLYFLAATTEIFGEKITTFEGLLKNQWAIFVGEVIFKNILISKANSNVAYMKDSSGCKVKRGYSLVSSLHLFKNGCDPMAHLYSCGNINVIITIQKIKRGQQIFIKFHPTFWEKPTVERRANLQNELQLYCRCKACTENWGPETLLTLPSHPIERWPVDIEDELRYFNRKYGPDFFEFTPKSIDLQLIRSTTIKMMNMYQRLIDHPTKELYMLKRRLITLFPSY